MKTLYCMAILTLSLTLAESLVLKIHLPSRGLDGKLVYDLEGKHTEKDLIHDFDYNGSLEAVRGWVQANRNDGESGNFAFMLMRPSLSFHVYKETELPLSLKDLELKSLIYPNARLTILPYETHP